MQNGNIVSELLAIIDAKKYKQIIPSLPLGAGLLENIFPHTQLAKKYSLDAHWWLDGSFMNPNALFELFRDYSGQTSLQVCKGMLKYLCMTKKKGTDECKILKNAWIALHMKGQTACQWADSMFDRDTLGDEIALYILCKMYKRHSLVFTSAKCWTTLETETHLVRTSCLINVMYDSCILNLVYLENFI